MGFSLNQKLIKFEKKLKQSAPPTFHDVNQSIAYQNSVILQVSATTGSKNTESDFISL